MIATELQEEALQRANSQESMGQLLHALLFEDIGESLALLKLEDSAMKEVLHLVKLIAYYVECRYSYRIWSRYGDWGFKNNLQLRSNVTYCGRSDVGLARNAYLDQQHRVENFMSMQEIKQLKRDIGSRLYTRARRLHAIGALKYGGNSPTNRPSTSLSSQGLVFSV